MGLLEPQNPHLLPNTDIGAFKEGDKVEIQLIANPSDQVYTPMTMQAQFIPPFDECGLKIDKDMLKGEIKPVIEWHPVFKAQDEANQPQKNGSKFDSAFCKAKSVDGQFILMYNYIIPGPVPVPMIATYTMSFSIACDYTAASKMWKEKYNKKWGDKNE